MSVVCPTNKRKEGVSHMSDKTKKKKIDVRLTDEMYREIAVFAWGMDMRRSELLRDMIMYFVKNAMITVEQ